MSPAPPPEPSALEKAARGLVQAETERRSPHRTRPLTAIFADIDQSFAALAAALATGEQTCSTPQKPPEPKRRRR